MGAAVIGAFSRSAGTTIPDLCKRDAADRGSIVLSCVCFFMGITDLLSWVGRRR